MKYSDEQRIEKIIEKTEALLRFIKDNNISENAILTEEPIQWAITTPLYNIGEHAYYISDEFKEKHPGIPWMKISGMRHRLVHDYEDTNWNIVVKTVFEVLPEFLDELKRTKQENI